MQQERAAKYHVPTTTTTAAATTNTATHPPLTAMRLVLTSPFRMAWMSTYAPYGCTPICGRGSQGAWYAPR